MDVYNIYTNTGNHVARGSFLSDIVITKIPLISCFMDLHKTHIVYSSAKTVSGCVFSLDWLIPGTNCIENQERCLHIVAQETINLNVTGERQIQVCT